MIPIYDKTKKLYPDHVVLMRFDDWVSALGDDAKTVSKVCGTMLAMSHDGHWYTGFFHSSTKHHLHKLIEAGHKVVLAEPIEERS